MQTPVPPQSTFQGKQAKGGASGTLCLLVDASNPARARELQCSLRQGPQSTKRGMRPRTPWRVRFPNHLRCDL